jgi:2-oxoglutarate ferredoxin oxidoreductase subunit alpha
MVEKRLKKAAGILREVVPPVYFGSRNPDLLLVAWGSAKGAVLEAAEELREAGKSLGVLYFSQVWPLVPDQFLGFLREAKEVVAVEGNATGQFAGLIRREAGFEIRKRLGRYDGLPITPEFILREMKN